MIKQIILSFLIIILSFTSSAQTLSDLEFGTDTTFEVVTWNLKYFPTKDQTAGYVKQIIESIDVDLFAIQEVFDVDAFQTMINGIDGYEMIYAPNYLALAFVYKTATITVNNNYEIYTSYWNQFPRSPFVIDVTFMGESFIVINNHFKCCGDGYLDMYDNDDEEKRRYDASFLIKDYIDNNMPNNRVIVVGDLNDILTESTYSNNVFQPFLDDDLNYEFADMSIAEGSSYNWSYPDWPSHIDHILITNEMFNEMDNAGSACETIKIDDYMSSYDYYVSDHRPVGIKIKPELGTGINIESLSEISLQCYPNPFNDHTTIFFDSAEERSELEIYTINGQRIETIQIRKGEKSVQWNAEGFPNGIYFAKLLNAKKVTAVTKLVLVK